MSRFIAFFVLVAFLSIAGFADGPLERVDVEAALSQAHDVGQFIFPGSENSPPMTIEGRGYVIDSSHPWRPGDFRRYDLVVKIAIDPRMNEARIDVTATSANNTSNDTYYIRDGRAFHFAEEKGESLPTSLGDISAPAVAMMHPTLLKLALNGRRINLEEFGQSNAVFAANNVLWRIQALDKYVLSRPLAAEAHEPQSETIMFSDVNPAVYDMPAVKVTFSKGAREVGVIEFGPTAKGEPFSIPLGTPRDDEPVRISYHSIVFDELAPGLFKIDLTNANSRIYVAEFADYLVVLEGAFNSKNARTLTDAIRARWPKKPVKYFAFSHIHGQYVGGVGIWAAEGATIVVPPTTEPLIRSIFAAEPFHYFGARSAQVSNTLIELVPKVFKLEDATNSLEIHNVISNHTDEYFIFFFPKAKILLTGDLLFLRPGQPLTGRSLNLINVTRNLGLDVDRYVATWPLTGFDTKNIATRDDVEAAMGGN